MSSDQPPLSDPEPGPRCHNCRFFDSGGMRHGFCRRYAPRPEVVDFQMIEDGEADFGASWPTTHVDDWCGEHSVL